MKRKKKGTIFIIIGILLIVAALSIVIYNKLDSDRAERAAKDVLGKLTDVIAENAKNQDTEEARNEEAFRKSRNIMAGSMIDGYEYIGEIIIPAADISLPVMSEWDMTRLDISPCRYTGTIYNNDLVICGHNHKHFSAIRYLDIGADVFFITINGEEIHYKVENLETVGPTEVEKMIDNVTGWDLTLFTCNISDATRCAVRCVRVED